MNERAKGALMLVIGIIIEVLCIRALATDGQGMDIGMAVWVLGSGLLAIGGLVKIIKGEDSKSERPLKNAGTQYINESQANTAWFAQHMNKNTPVIMSRYKSLEDAKNALLSLSFIKQVNGEIISTEVVDYGYYTVKDGQSEVIICGHGFKHNMFTEAKDKLTKFGGTIKEAKEPEKSASQPKKAAKSGVKFVEKTKNELAAGIFATYMIYKAGSESEAKEFLQTQNVSQQLFYIVVDTPDGSFGKDINGIYKE